MPYDSDEESALRCEMINAHHVDCGCRLCKAGRDCYYDKPAVGFTWDGSDQCRVCNEHAAVVEDDPAAYGKLTRYTTPGAKRGSTVIVPVAQIEFREGGDTIWVHGPDGGTVLRLKVMAGDVTSEQCVASPVSHCDAYIQHPVKFCLAATKKHAKAQKRK